VIFDSKSIAFSNVGASSIEMESSN
jgi:hypothetical protein